MRRHCIGHEYFSSTGLVSLDLVPWQRHALEALSVLLVLSEGCSLPADSLYEGPVMRNIDSFLLLICAGCWANGRVNGDLQSITLMWRHCLSYNAMQCDEMQSNTKHKDGRCCIIYKTIERHIVHTTVSWPNLKQWQMVDTSDLIMIIS